MKRMTKSAARLFARACELQREWSVRAAICVEWFHALLMDNLLCPLLSFLLGLVAMAIKRGRRVWGCGGAGEVECQQKWVSECLRKTIKSGWEQMFRSHPSVCGSTQFAGVNLKSRARYTLSQPRFSYVWKKTCTRQMDCFPYTACWIYFTYPCGKRGLQETFG